MSRVGGGVSCFFAVVGHWLQLVEKVQQRDPQFVQQ